MSNSPTAQQFALRYLLPYIGVTSLAPQAAGAELEDIQPVDLHHAAGAITSAYQEIWAKMPAEDKERPGYGVLHSPTDLTISVNQYSTAMTVGAEWNDWMIGCTVKIQGDSQDNEIISSTKLARPYMGNTAQAVATVYGDAIVLDSTIGKVMDPVRLPNQSPLWPCSNRMEFDNIAGQPLVTDTGSTQTYGTSFFYFFRKTVARPRAWFVEGFYDPDLSYTPRRLRFAPLPDQAYSVAYRAAMNPPRVIATDIDPGNHTDPGTILPFPDELIESIFAPIALKWFSAYPSFKNDSLRPVIEDRYRMALAMLGETRGQISVRNGAYIT